MPFIHPAIFWTGLAAVSVPIIIHLLNRRRFKILDWAAMKFLLESIRKNRRRLRIEELILLALRCLAVFLLALAVARYTGCSALNVLPGGTGSQAVVYVLDDSYSMGQKIGAGTLLTSATSDLAEQVKKHSPDDSVAILLTSRPDPNDVLFRSFLKDKESKDALVARLGALQPSDLRARLADSLAAAGKVFQEEKAATKRLYVLSDFRRADLAAPEAEAIRQRFAELAKDGVELIAMDYGREGKSNLTLQSVELLDKFAVAKAPARVRTSVRNTGTMRAENVELRVHAKYTVERKIVEQDLPRVVFDFIDPGETKSQELAFTAPQAGAAVLSAALPADELPGDNTAHLALNVRQAVRVLVVDGKPDLADPDESESFYFVAAIDPKGDASHGYRADVVTRESLTAVNFNDYDLVVLLNLSDFPAQPPEKGSADPYVQLAALERYVRGGGGLAIFTGDNVNLDFYKKRMYGEGLGLLPFPIRARVGDPSSFEKFYRLDPKSVAADPMLRCFRGEAAAFTNVIRFFAFHKADETVAPGSAADIKPPRVLARFTDGDNSPAIVVRQYGEGNVMTFYTTAGARWTDWPQETELATYVLVVRDMMWELAKRQAEAKAPLVGAEIVHDLTDDLRDAKSLLKTPRYPAADVIPLVARFEDGKSRLRYPRVTEAGVYTIGFEVPGGTGREVYFARNVDPAEGELAPGHQGELASALGSNEFKYVPRWETGLGSPVVAQAEREYWMWAIALMLLVLAVETFLGQRFGHYTT